MSKNPTILRPGANIGNSSAEADDEFLFECFVDHPAVSIMADLSSSKFFISGRTGSGKTAVLRMLEKQNKNVSSVDLHELALGYLANSTIF
jgi:Cdc6-like AAA superfamily ATPase